MANGRSRKKLKLSEEDSDAANETGPNSLVNESIANFMRSDVISESGLPEMEAVEVETDNSADMAINSDEMDWNFGRFQQDRQTLLDMLPEDIWYLIFEKLGFDDTSNLSNSSQFLRFLLSKQRTDFLFPGVWKILGRQYETVDHSAYREDGCIKEKSSSGQGPSVAERGTKKEPRICTSCGRKIFVRWYSGILNLRLVCKTWSETIDTFFERIMLHSMDKFNADVTGPISAADSWSYSAIQPKWNDINSMRLVRKFRKHFQETHGGSDVTRSPFVGKYLLLSFGYDTEDGEEQEQLVNAMIRLVSKYGHHLRSFKVDVVTSGSDEVYKIIRRLMAKMQNLESFEIGWEDIFPEDQFDVHRALVRRLPLPNLPKLQYFKTSEPGGLPPRIFREFLRANPHLSKLWAYMYLFWRCPARISFALRNLREISLYVGSKEDVNILNRYVPNWPLTKLGIKFAAWHIRNREDLERVFLLITSKWGQSLTTLFLGLPFFECTQENQSSIDRRIITDFPNIVVSNLRHLRLSVKSAISMDLILPLKNTLEFLEVVGPRPCRGDKKEEEKQRLIKLEEGSTIQFFSCSGSPSESNIWTLLPNLKEIQYCQVEGEPVSTENHSWIYRRAEWNQDNMKKISM